MNVIGQFAYLIENFHEVVGVFTSKQITFLEQKKTNKTKNKSEMSTKKKHHPYIDLTNDNTDNNSMIYNNNNKKN